MSRCARRGRGSMRSHDRRDLQECACDAVPLIKLTRTPYPQSRVPAFCEKFIKMQQECIHLKEDIIEGIRTSFPVRSMELESSNLQLYHPCHPKFNACWMCRRLHVLSPLIVELTDFQSRLSVTRRMKHDEMIRSKYIVTHFICFI